MRARKTLRALVFSLFTVFALASAVPGCAFLQKHESSITQAADAFAKTAELLKLLDAAGVEYIEGLPVEPTAEQLARAASLSRDILGAHSHLVEAKKRIKALDVKGAHDSLREAIRDLNRVCDTLEAGGVDCKAARASLEDLFDALELA